MRMVLFLKGWIVSFIFLLLQTCLRAQTFNYRKSIADYESGMTISFGAYQSYASSYIHFRHKGSTPIFHPQAESSIYRWLIARIVKPRYLVFQFTAYPLAIVSSQLETFHPKEFNRFEFMGMNLLRAIGSGPEEPYALSLLLGNLAFLGYQSRIKIKQSGSALAGFLITTGHWHIYDNIRINDRWWQIELILTGVLKETNKRKLTWNFRMGTKLHKNNLVTDVVVISLHRNHIQWHYQGFSLLRNSLFQYEAHFPVGREWKQSPFTIRQLISYSKIFPFRILGRFVAVRIGGGVLWEWIRLYDHKKRLFEPEQSTQLIWLIQPSIEF